MAAACSRQTRAAGRRRSVASVDAWAGTSARIVRPVLRPDQGCGGFGAPSAGAVTVSDPAAAGSVASMISAASSSVVPGGQVGLGARALPFGKGKDTPRQYGEVSRPV